MHTLEGGAVTCGQLHSPHFSLPSRFLPIRPPSPLARSTSPSFLALVFHPLTDFLSLSRPHCPHSHPPSPCPPSFLAAPQLREQVPQSPAPLPVQRNEYFYGDSPQVPRVPMNLPVSDGAWREAEERWREGVRAGGRAGGSCVSMFVFVCAACTVTHLHTLLLHPIYAPHCNIDAHAFCTHSPTAIVRHDQRTASFG